MSKFKNITVMFDYKCPKCGKFINLFLPYTKGVPISYECECGRGFTTRNEILYRKSSFTLKTHIKKLKK